MLGSALPVQERKNSLTLHLWLHASASRLYHGRTSGCIVKHLLPPCNLAFGAVQENGNWGVNQQPSSSMNSGTFQCSPNQGGGFSVSAWPLAPPRVYVASSKAQTSTLAGRIVHMRAHVQPAVYAELSAVVHMCNQLCMPVACPPCCITSWPTALLLVLQRQQPHLPDFLPLKRDPVHTPGPHHPDGVQPRQHLPIRHCPTHWLHAHHCW